jgi:hypothetical protein
LPSSVPSPACHRNWIRFPSGALLKKNHQVHYDVAISIILSKVRFCSYIRSTCNL